MVKTEGKEEKVKKKYWLMLSEVCLTKATALGLLCVVVFYTYPGGIIFVIDIVSSIIT